MSALTIWSDGQRYWVYEDDDRIAGPFRDYEEAYAAKRILGALPL